MKTGELITSFQGRISLPIDVNEVVAALVASGEDADIEFIGVDLDPDILQGKIKIFYLRNGVYADPKKHANIYYHRGHSTDWQRFICCKEVLHIMDPQGAQTTTIPEIDLLAEKIGLPPEMQDPLNDGLATNVDRLAEWRAAAVLLPLASRQILLSALRAGQLTLDDIARMADIPRRYVGLVMSPSWESLHALLIK